MKNRLHLDLNPGDRTLATELERLTALGATILSYHKRGPGLGWDVLADPEGNEFCVQSSDAEVAAAEDRLEAGDDQITGFFDDFADLDASIYSYVFIRKESFDRPEPMLDDR